jgi:hypothetical protein
VGWSSGAGPELPGLLAGQWLLLRKHQHVINGLSLRIRALDCDGKRFTVARHLACQRLHDFATLLVGALRSAGINSLQRDRIGYGRADKRIVFSVVIRGVFGMRRLPVRANPIVVSVTPFPGGFGGTLLILGPVLVIVLGVAKVVPVATVIVMEISVALLYAIAVLKLRRQGMSFIKAVAKDTVLTFAFYVLGAVIVGVVAAVS